MILHATDFLIILMALARQHDHIAKLSLGQGPADGRRPVRLHMDLGVLALQSGQDVGNDGLRLLGAGVIGGNHSHISQLPRHRSHHGALAPVPVSAAAEHTDQPVRSMRVMRQRQWQTIGESQE